MSFCCRRRRRRNQVRCYVFIDQVNFPVRGAIVSCTFCNSGRRIFRRTDAFGVAVFDLPDGEFLFRCECVPNFLSPSQADFCVKLNSCNGEADLLFPAALLDINAINTNPLTNTLRFNQSPIINNIAPLIGNNAQTNPMITNNRVVNNVANTPINLAPQNTSASQNPAFLPQNIPLPPQNTTQSPQNTAPAQPQAAQTAASTNYSGNPLKQIHVNQGSARSIQRPKTTEYINAKKV